MRYTWRIGYPKVLTNFTCNCKSLKVGALKEYICSHRYHIVKKIHPYRFLKTSVKVSLLIKLAVVWQVQLVYKT